LKAFGFDHLSLEPGLDFVLFGFFNIFVVVIEVSGEQMI